MRSVLVCCAVLVLPVLSLCSRGRDTAKVTGTVSVLDDETALVPGALILFQRSDGQNVKVTTNQVGEYEVVLDPEYDYTVAVGGNALCEIHRPEFRPKPGSALRFDFTTTVCGIIDYRVTTAPPGTKSVLKPEPKPNDSRPHYRQYYRSSYDSKAPYWFFEESIALGKKEDQWLVIAFGERDEDGQIKYGPFLLPKSPAIHLPVTISFGTYSVRADRAEWDQKRRTLRAEGNVAVADGLNHPPRRASCVLLDLHRTPPKPKGCQN
jgi:hypothetical protein